MSPPDDDTATVVEIDQAALTKLLKRSQSARCGAQDKQTAAFAAAYESATEAGKEWAERDEGENAALRGQGESATASTWFAMAAVFGEELCTAANAQFTDLVTKHWAYWLAGDHVTPASCIPTGSSLPTRLKEHARRAAVICSELATAGRWAGGG